MDLNLYRVFLEIRRQGSVTGAARALGLTQPAASNALSRLRRQLGDPLFLRSRDGMVATKFADDIASRVERAVEDLRAMGDQRGGELPPLASLRRQFTIAMSDLEETLFLPSLIRGLGREAPGIRLKVRPFRRATLQNDLEAGGVDLAVAYLSTPFKHVISSDLSAQTFACVARRGHPSLGGELTMAQFVSLAHLLVAPDKGDTRGVIDRCLAELGARRRVQFSVPHFLLACHLAAQSDYLLTIPRQLAEAVIDFYPLALHTLPFDVPGFTIGMHWHRARDRDPELASFRSFVSAVAIEAAA